MSKKSLVSISDYSKDEILSILESAAGFEANPNRKTLDGKVIATLFFEPSTRTRLSFETAVVRLGGKIIGFSDAAPVARRKAKRSTIPFTW
jgi:aspartate carbamoyltransferase catalytic subunit